MTRGVRQIVRFNWPFYAGATAAVILTVLAIGRLPLNASARAVLYAATALPALWIASSLIASWIVYDRSPLMRWEWIDQALGFTPDAWINIHAGLDESTMALRALLGLLPRKTRIAAGSIEFAGEDLVQAGEDRRRELRGTSLAMIFQEPMTALNPVMRVGEQIAEGPLVRLGDSRSAARARALELMRLVGIPDPARRASAYPHELSGGMRQRVMIAIALSGNPKLILCDEPTTALDVTIQDQILSLLSELQEEQGMAIVLVSHDLGVVRQLADTVSVLEKGRVVEQGSVEKVFADPREAYTRTLLASIPQAR